MILNKAAEDGHREAYRRISKGLAELTGLAAQKILQRVKETDPSEAVSGRGAQSHTIDHRSQPSKYAFPPCA